MTEREVFERLFLFARCATLQLFTCDGYSDLEKKILNPPTSIFSGCFYKEYIMSVLHGCYLDTEPADVLPKQEKKHGTVSVYISSEDGIRYQILRPMWLLEMKIKGDQLSNFGEIDFFLSKYDSTQKYRCEVLDDDTDELFRYERVGFNEIHSPCIGEPYFFCGNTESAIGSGTKRIFSKTLFASCEFCGELTPEEGKGNYCYKFELPNIIKDFSEIEGCSGSPIFNNEGKLVSIVCGGWKDTPYIYGINLEKLQPIIEDTALWK